MTDARVTLVVTPREKFSVCRRSLDSILADTDGAFELVYVDGGSPPRVRRYVDEMAARHGFKVVRSAHYLTPNAARLMALPLVGTEYVVFIDNDVVVKPGWLAPLVRTADESGAAAVSPLICQGHPLHEIVHCAGGEAGIKVIRTDEGEERHLFERIAKQGRKVEDVLPRLRRGPTGLCEFHCVLMRTDWARRPGLIDEGLWNTREHVDLSIGIDEAGGEIWLEPESVVTYLHDTPLTATDLPYFMLRWGDAWERRSLTHLIAKRRLTTKGTAGYRLNNIGWRRRSYLVLPFARRIANALPKGYRPTTWAVTKADRMLNRLLSWSHDRRTGGRSRAGTETGR